MPLFDTFTQGLYTPWPRGIVYAHGFSRLWFSDRRAHAHHSM